MNESNNNHLNHKKSNANNEHLISKFESVRTVETFNELILFELYVAEDYGNVVGLVRKNIDLCSTDLLFVAADVAIGWSSEHGEILDVIYDRRENFSNLEMSIYFYLKALELDRLFDAPKDELKFLLLTSMEYFEFPENCLFYHRKIDNNPLFLKKALSKVERTFSAENLVSGEEKVEYSYKAYIEELILGTVKNESIYNDLTALSCQHVMQDRLDLSIN